MRYLAGRFAGIMQVSKKTLRHYREIGLLPPAGIDPDNGYVYYEEAQRIRMLRIQYLRKLGFSLDQIGELLSDASIDWLSVAQVQLTHVRANKRSLEAIEREFLGWAYKLENGKEVFDSMDTKQEFATSTFTLTAPVLIIGRGVRVPYNKREEKEPMIGGLIDGFFGDDVPSQIPHRTTPQLRFGIVGEYDGETGIGTYMMGNQVTTLQEIPEGMRGFTLAEGLYARIVFSAQDKETLVGPALDEAYGRLYGWLPTTGYQEAEMLAVEVYRDEAFELPSNPSMEIWTRVVPKEA